jgi:hypothetical protein
MKKNRFTEEQIIAVLKQLEAGRTRLIKVILFWVSYILVVHYTWPRNFLRGNYADSFFFWCLLFIPVFAITWKWATELQTVRPRAASASMAIRRWHPIKIILLWISYFLVVHYTWHVTYRSGITDELVYLFWCLLFIPVFAVTWEWTIRLQKASNFPQEERPAQVGLLDPSRRWREIALFLIVAALGGAGVYWYWYKNLESQEIGSKWIRIQDNAHESSPVVFSDDATKSLRTHGVKIEVKQIYTEVQFSKLHDEEYAVLNTRGYFTPLISNLHPDVKDNNLDDCTFYLTFELYDKDNMLLLLVGEFGHRRTLQLQSTLALQSQGLVDEMRTNSTLQDIIPMEMVRRTATIKRKVIFNKCNETSKISLKKRPRKTVEEAVDDDGVDR